MTPSGFVISFSFQGGQPKQQILQPGVYTIGRSSECDVVLPHDGVSRRHAQVEISPSECCLMDLGSANGTTLDGSPLFPRRKVPILPGQTIQIFEFELKLEPLDTSQRPEERPRPVPLPLKPAPLPGPAAIPYPFPSKPAFPILRYQSENGPWQDLPLTDGEQVIGRDPACQVFLDSKLISRRHASLLIKGGQVWVTDLGSRNGVIRNGQPIPPNQAVLLQPGDSFQISEFLFQIPGAPPQVSPSLSSPLSATFATPSPSQAAPPRSAAFTAAVGPSDSTMLEEDMGAAIKPVLKEIGGLNLAGQERVTIGRAPDNTLVLNHPMISRYHGLIERMGTRTRITDLHSANGIYINGQPIKEQTWLKEGDVLKIGPYQMNFTGNELQHAGMDEGYAIDVIGMNKWVSKSVNLLKDINISVGPNEFVALVGMSGAGKSTLMDAINGFRPATQGKVLINGVDLYQNYGMFRDDIGNVPQKDIVHMELTAEQALNYAAMLRMPADTTGRERKAAVAETLEDLGMTFKKSVPISRLSGGQLKRVSIGVELLTKPRLFFLDEPTSGLDPGTEYEMMKLLRRLADQGRTIMLITHATKNVMFCDRAIILCKGGNLAFYGPPEEALEYFDTFRTPRERLEKNMEFDDIYRILQDEKRGKPEEWRERFLQSKYVKYIAPRHQPSPTGKIVGSGRQHRGRRIGAIKQFFIVSARNIKCMLMDRVSLALTLALAPVLGLMNFIWRSKLFDPVQGDSTKVMSMWFITAVIVILVGAMGSMREIVKEADIYKRERAVGLRILPYVLSKIWIGMALAVYQGFFLLFFVVILVRPAVASLESYVALLITMILGVICGYMLGLVISALVPNQNSAQIVLIGFLVPQFLFAGMLMPLDKIPLGNVISPAISTRWTFEAFISSTGMGDLLVADPCWNQPKEERVKLSSTQKEQCICMGPNIFINCSKFPGIKSPDYYDEAAKVSLAQGEPPKPLEPTRLPSPTPLSTPTQIATPTMFPTPTPIYTPTRLLYPVLQPEVIGTDAANSGRSIEEESMRDAHYQANQYKLNTEKQAEEYRLTREAQFTDYKGNVIVQFDEYQNVVKTQIAGAIDDETNSLQNYADNVEGQYRDYEKDMRSYGGTITDWERNRQEAIGAAETILSIIWNDYGGSFKGTVFSRWFNNIIICVVEFFMILILQKRKDVV